jgi:hypothetical protein
MLHRVLDLKGTKKKRFAFKHINSSARNKENKYSHVINFKTKVDSKGFWRWCITLGITGFLDFVHRAVF